MKLTHPTTVKVDPFSVNSWPEVLTNPEGAGADELLVGVGVDDIVDDAGVDAGAVVAVAVWH